LLAGNTAFIPTDFESIQTITVGSGGTSTVSFTSIPSTYKHLQIRAFWQPVTSISWFQFKFNSDSTGNNYVSHDLRGDGSAAGSSGTRLSGNFAFASLYGATPATNVFGAAVVDILDYTSTSKYKTLRSLSGTDANGSGYVNFISAFWSNTAALTRIDINTNNGQNIAQGSTFALYGVK
jgi:hypothetical protein